jgi:hypothetical protein
MFEHESIADWECRMIKQAILKSAENLHLTPIFLAEELIRAFEVVDKHYTNNFTRVDSVVINPCRAV